MTNQEIKLQMKKDDVRQWEVADKIGVAESTFTRWLRKEVSNEQKTLILQAIRAVARQKQAQSNSVGVGQ